MLGAPSPASRADLLDASLSTLGAPPPAPHAAPAATSPVEVHIPAKDVRFIYQRRNHTSSAAVDPIAPAPLSKGAVVVPPVVNQHSMTTRAKQGYRIPSLYHAAPLSPILKTFRSALADPNWRAAMEEEHDALIQNLVPHPTHANVVSGK